TNVGDGLNKALNGLSDANPTLLRNLCEQMATAFRIPAVFVSRVGTDGSIQCVDFWTESGQPKRPGQSFEGCPCAKLGVGEIQTFPSSSFPAEFRDFVETVGGGECFLTAVAMHEWGGRHIGSLSLVHLEEQLDGNRCPKGLLRLCGNWVVAEILRAKYRAEIMAMGFQLDLVEQGSHTASLRCRSDGQIVWASRHLQGMLKDDENAMATETLGSLIRALGCTDSETMQSKIRDHMRRGEHFETNLPMDMDGHGKGRISIRAHPLGDAGDSSVGECVCIVQMSGSLQKHAELDGRVHPRALRIR
ncbi:MAG: hypothetical protein ACNA8P_13770, partial [Phycisphaerales bacterium]